VLVYRYSAEPLAIHYVSPRVEGFIGLPAEVIRAEPSLIFQALHPDDRHLLVAAGGDLSPLHSPVTLRWRHRNGRTVWGQHHHFPVPASAGREHLGLGIDVTAQMTPEQARREPRLNSSALRALGKRIEQMREAERTRIARELHDELGQLLTGTKLDFSTALRRLREERVPGDVVDTLQSAMGQIDLGIQMVRSIATDLRPPALDHRDLGAAIEDEARRVSARSGVPVRVASRLEVQVHPDVATAAFRVFQEALTNAVRHSKATLVSVVLGTTRRGRLVLHVRDNGVGIPRGQLPGRLRHGPESLGLLGMIERAHAVGGEVRIRSTVGRGTRVLLALPLGLVP
jgi:signal transduction histidine kinase